MYVFRPQHSVGHAPGASSANPRGAHHHISRQAAKNQRRTQPKPRRSQAQHRRHALRDIVGRGDARSRLCLTTDATQSGQSHGATHPSHPGVFAVDAGSHDRAAGIRYQNGVRTRLRLRLVQRSCVELVAALERRHSDKWTEHVLRGDFEAVEGMRRICEAFCLRPALEQQVLKATADRARAVQSSRAEKRSILTSEQESWMAQCSRSKQSGVDAKNRADSDDETASTSDGDSLTGTLDGTCSEAASVDDSLVDGSPVFFEAEEEEESAACEFFFEAEDAMNEELTTSGASGSENEATSTVSLRVPWRGRVLRALGLQQLWPGRASTATDSSGEQLQQDIDSEANLAETGENQEEEEDEGDEDEEEQMNSKLVAAVRNAELHAANARAEQALRHRTANPQRQDISSPAKVGSNRGCTKVTYARKSEVAFFSFDLDTTLTAAAILEYRRPLETKVFDGPSGHKARRINTSEAKNSHLRDEDEVSTGASGSHSTSEDEEEEWEDRCDDIAELMGHERSCLLWSPSW